MTTSNIIVDNKEWIFSGIGVAIIIWIITFITRQKKSSHLITVTTVGGAFMGPARDTPLTINKNDIASLDDPYPGELGTTVIVMRDGKRHYVTETKAKVTKITKGLATSLSSLRRICNH